jgi:hypothetical protein
MPRRQQAAPRLARTKKGGEEEAVIAVGADTHGLKLGVHHRQR